jgi:transposase
MIDRQTVFEIHRLRNEGLAVRKISRMLKINRETVLSYLNNPLRKPVPRVKASRKLEPFKEEIARLLELDPQASAVVIGQRISTKGYAGGITILRDYLRVLGRRTIERTAYIRFESPPGEQMQIDWGHFGTLVYNGHLRKLYALAVTESFSRMLYVQFTHSQKQETLQQGLLDAFLFFGGCPRELVFDNMPTAVTERVGRLIRFNDRFLTFLTQLRIFPSACNPGAAHEKGKVERAIGYLRKNFWPLRRFADLADVNHQVRDWLASVANVRLHQGTGERPGDRFKNLVLQPLPTPLPDCRQTLTVKVHKDFAVRFDANSYTAPPWSIGRLLTLKADQLTVSLYDRHKPIVTHPRCWQRKQRIELPAHQELVRKIHKTLWADRHVALFAALGPAAREYLNALSEAHQPIKKSVHRLLALSDQYGSPSLLWAIEKALAHRAYGADYIQNILYQQMLPRRRHLPVSLKKPELNDIRLPPPSLAEYDSLVLKRRNPHDD